MDQVITLFCNYKDSTLLTNLTDATKIQDLVNCVRARWVEISNDCINLSYELVGHPSCLLDFDEDLVVLLSYCRMHDVVSVNVYVLTYKGAFGDEDSEDGEVSSDGVTEEDECDVEDDLLPTFCIDPERPLLSSGWEKGLTKVGQRFEGGVVQFHEVLCKYAIEVGFKFKYIKNDLLRVTAECEARKATRCEWHVHGRIQSSNGFFYVKKLVNDHTCGAAYRTRKNPRLSSDLISSLITEQVREKPLTRPIDVVHFFSSNYGMTINYNHAWWAVEKAKKQIYGDQSLSYDKLRWYVDTVQQTNPGSHIQLQYDNSTKRFYRIFIAFYACIQGFKHCRPLLFLDGTFLKGRYKGTLLAATGKNGNQGLFPLAFAIVDSENDDNWEWFLKQLNEILDPLRAITFVSDRNNGILKSVPAVFPNSYHGYCLHHLKCNLREKLSGMSNAARDNIIKLFRLCAYAPTEALFNYRMHKLLNEGGDKVRGFISTIPKENWSNAFFKGQRYGEMCSNVAESFNAWIRTARHLPIMSLIDAIRVQIMNFNAKRRDEVKGWNGFLCPEIDKRLQETLRVGRTWGVSKSSDFLFEVQSNYSCTVDIYSRTCSCCQWQVNGFPCAHASIALQKSGYDLNEYVDAYFSIQSFVDTYVYAISPIPTFGKEDFVGTEVVIKPPISKRPPGRPKKKRIPSRGEEVRHIKCSTCGKIGHHNRQTCKEATQD